jgi:glycosyltransferase involved in cell wall biosynthesis
MTTIVIPCFNQRRYLAEAALSALAQRQVDVIVIDDGSTDGSADVASRYPGVRVIRQPNAGVAAARNAGLHEASGEFVLFLDADDRLTAGAIERLRAALEAHPRAALAYGRHTIIDADGMPIQGTVPPRAPGSAFNALLRSNFITVPGAVLYRRAVLVGSGGFALRLDGAADYDMYLRLARQYPIVPIEEVVVEYRRHGASMSANPRAMLAATLKAHGRHGRQTGDEASRDAYRAGRRFWQAFYGDQVMDQARLAWKRRALPDALSNLAWAAWLAPNVVLNHAARAARVRMGRRSQRNLYKANRLSS